MNQLLTANEFNDFLKQQQALVASAFKEVEEAQKEFQGKYTQFKTNHDKTMMALVDAIAVMPTESLGKGLRAQIDARVPAERKAIDERIAKLQKNDMPDMLRQADYLVKKGQKEESDLRDVNPKLNEKEEALKAELAQWQQKLDGLNVQVSEQAKGLGFLFNVLKINDLDQQRHQTLGRIQAVAENLKKVREEWKGLQELASKNESQWQAEWRTKMQHYSVLKQEFDTLSQDPDALARRRAITFVIDNLKTPIADAPSAIAPQLGQMIDLNVQTDNFHDALTSVAGILGIAKGMIDGMNRMMESVKALIDEQSRHSAYLGSLSIDVPDEARNFAQVWTDIASKTKDEKALAQHPADYVASMKPIVDQRLSNAQIAKYFDLLGGSLKRATAGWSKK
jgi:hypothetical protein